MKSVNIVGASILGLVSGINLLKKGCLVNIYEKRAYVGGMLNSFSGVKLSKPQLFNYLVLDKDESVIFKKRFNFLEYEQVQIYKSIRFNENTFIDIKVGSDEIKKIFLGYLEKDKDKTFIKNLLNDVQEVYRLEQILKDYSESSFFSLDRWGYERNLKSIKGKYIKVKVENIVDKVESEITKEILKSLVNVKCSAYVLIDMLKYLSFYNIYGVNNIFEKLKNEFLKLGGNIYFSSNISKIESKELKGIVNLNNQDIESDYVICTVNNFYSLKGIFNEKILEKDFHKMLQGGELFDSYAIINLYFKESKNINTNITRYILEKPFIDNTGSFHRKFEFSFEKTMEIGSLYIRGNYHFWEKLNDKKANQIGYSKFVLAQKFLNELKKCNKELNECDISKVEVITPYDFMQENDCIRGASRGIIPTPKFFNKIIVYKNDMDRCYFTREKLGCGMYINSKLKDSVRIIEKILLE